MAFGVYGLHFASNLYILQDFKHLSLFDPKWRNITKTPKQPKQLTGERFFFGSYSIIELAGYEQEIQLVA